jgi:hypothetical protein
MNKSRDAVRATKGYQPEGDVGESKEQAPFSRHRRVKRLSSIPLYQLEALSPVTPTTAYG